MIIYGSYSIGTIALLVTIILCSKISADSSKVKAEKAINEARKIITKVERNIPLRYQFYTDIKKNSEEANNSLCEAVRLKETGKYNRAIAETKLAVESILICKALNGKLVQDYRKGKIWLIENEIKKVKKLITEKGGMKEVDLLIFNARNFIQQENYDESWTCVKSAVRIMEKKKGKAVSKKVKKVKKANKKKVRIYEVKPGDCLWNIAGKFYKKPVKWSMIYKIYNANKAVIKKDDWIYIIHPGQELKIPK